MSPEFWRSLAQIAAWGVALVWGARTTEAMNRLREVVDLTGTEWDDAWPEGEPSLLVVVPARDEEKNIAQTLEALTQQEYRELFVVAVDDRSTDETGALMEAAAARWPDRVGVMHVKELPQGWLGKTHALEVAVNATESEWVLFTDADVLFSPSSLRRALAYAVREHTDHLVVMPTMQVRTWGEGVMMGFFQTLGLWATRPWRVADADAKHDVIGVGAFNLVRREALEKLRGLGPQRLTVLEDITLGRRIRAARMRQRVAFAPGLILVHWAAGARGLVRVMGKNLFSGFNFRASLVVVVMLWIALFYLAPLAMLGWKWTIIPGVIIAACMSVAFRLLSEKSWIPEKYAWGLPLGAALFCWAMLRSVGVVWKDRGVKWRGTIYPLRELRRWNSPWQWK